MTTPLFSEISGRPRVEALLLQVSGDSAGDREIVHNDSLTVAVPATAAGIWDPSTHTAVVAAAINRSLVIWSGIPKYAFIPGPACFGRIVTLHCCWVPPGHATPVSAAQFQQMPGYEVGVFGGVADPNFQRGWRDVPFSTSRHKVLISNVIKISSPMKLAWWFEAADVGEKKGSGAFFFLRIQGQVEVFGSFM